MILKQTPGLFIYTNANSAIVTIVLDHVVGTVHTRDGDLHVHCHDGADPFTITEGSVVDQFNKTLEEHIADKQPVVSVLGESCTASAIPGMAFIKSPDGTATSLGDQFCAEAGSETGLFDLLHAMGMARDLSAPGQPPTQIHQHNIDLTGVDVNDKTAMAHAVRMTAAAIKLINGDEAAPLKGDLGSTYLPANKTILLQHINHWNNCMQAGRLVAFAPGDTIRVVHQDQRILDKAEHDRLVNELLASQTREKKLLRVVERAHTAHRLLAEVITPTPKG